jgi:hypothetical protein
MPVKAAMVVPVLVWASAAFATKRSGRVRIPMAGRMTPLDLT